MSIKESLSVFDVSSSGLAAQRLRMALVVQNVANANSVAGPDGKPYQRKEAIFAEMVGEIGSQDDENRFEGVKLESIVTSPVEAKTVYNPDHPMADKNGFVRYPNVDTMTEMVQMVSASRSYEANLSVMKTYRQMLERTLSLLR